MKDSLTHYHMLDFKARAALAVTTEVTREAQRRHGLDPITTIALGRALSCVALLASTLKQGKEYVHGSFSGKGLLSKVLAECNGDGDCRGYTVPARIMEDQPSGTPVPGSVGEALGSGTLTIVRGRPGDPSPYTAVVELQTGEIASDMARYLAESEQIPSAVAAGVKLAPDGSVLAAGGILVQRLGGAELDDRVLTDLEARMAAIGISDRLARGERPDEIVAMLQGQDPSWGVLTNRPLQFRCSSSRDKMAGALMGLGEDQLRSIKEETGRIEVRCPYCADTQFFRLEELIRQ